jgi:diaminohydroxyphosphoribosylaminopyrimidine deaminase/5-amino-6-(5-phosphoribosylamino)uracil reductase
MSASLAEIAAMHRAIALSALGLGTTSPNPAVGCVILDAEGRHVGDGYHRRTGESHAEVHALTAAGTRARGGTAVVTLEPCNHVGRTPPCRQALIDAGIVRAVIAVIDPSSRGGGGADRLREAGVSVETGVLADEARVVLGPWLTALDSGRPRVVWVSEITTDGAVPVRDDVFEEAGLRYQVDAIVHADGQVEEGVPGTHGRGGFALPATVTITEPAAVLSMLYQAGARTVLLHGGLDLAAQFLDPRLVDEAYVFRATTSASLFAPSPVECGTELPAGFGIRSVRKLSGGALIEALPR